MDDRDGGTGDPEASDVGAAANEEALSPVEEPRTKAPTDAEAAWFEDEPPRSVDTAPLVVVPTEPRRAVPAPPVESGPAGRRDRPGRGVIVRRGIRRVLRTLLPLAAVAVLIVATAGLIVAALARVGQERAAAEREVARLSLDPLAGAAAPRASTDAAQIVTVIGGEEVTGAASGVTASQRWPALLDAALGTRTGLATASGAGYATRGAGGRTYARLASAIPTSSSLVLLVGGQADAGISPESVSRAASGAIAAVRTRAPKATVVVVGPLVAGRTRTGALAEFRGAVRRAADTGKAEWVDPSGAGWFPSPGLPGSSAALTAQDERTIAIRLRPTLLALLS